jgi:hypothetical protein
MQQLFPVRAIKQHSRVFFSWHYLTSCFSTLGNEGKARSKQIAPYV